MTFETDSVMSTDRVYKQAIKRVFAKRYHDERMAIYLG